MYAITIHTILSANHVVYASKVDRKWNSNNNLWGSKISFLQLTSSTSSKEIPKKDDNSYNDNGENFYPMPSLPTSNQVEKPKGVEATITKITPPILSSDQDGKSYNDKLDLYPSPDKTALSPAPTSSSCPCKPIKSNLRTNSDMSLLEIGINCEGIWCKIKKTVKNGLRAMGEAEVKKAEMHAEASDVILDKVTGQRKEDDMSLNGGRTVRASSDVNDDEAVVEHKEGKKKYVSANVDMLSKAAFIADHTYDGYDKIPTAIGLKQLGKTIKTKYPETTTSAEFIRTFFDEEPIAQVKVYKSTDEKYCWVGYRGSSIKHDWLTNIKTGNTDLVDVALATGLLVTTRKIPIVGSVARAEILRHFGKGMENEKKQCVHRGFYEHMKLSLPEVLERLVKHKCKPETTVVVGHSLGIRHSFEQIR